MTNAGKTFTVSGTEEKPGLLPRALSALFEHIEALPEQHGSLPSSVSAQDLIVQASYLEIYNDQCFDLLHGSLPASGSGGGATFSSSLRALIATTGSNAGAGSVTTGAVAGAPVAPAPRVPLQIHDGGYVHVGATVVAVTTTFAQRASTCSRGLAPSNAPTFCACSDGVAVVKGLRQVHVKSADAALNLLREGAANKRVCARAHAHPYLARVCAEGI
ncbi:hypothetical protein EON66_10440 [archaeon]|nr:MAG: hypothetical protein EON66_10440 [archaeon]